MSSVGHFCREAAIARAVGGPPRLWTDPEIWDQIMEQFVKDLLDRGVVGPGAHYQRPHRNPLAELIYAEASIRPALTGRRDHVEVTLEQ